VFPVNYSHGTSAERYQVTLSDGAILAQGMFATQNNYRIREKEITDLSLIRITSFVTNVVRDRSLVIVLGFEIVDPHQGHKISNPVDIITVSSGRRDPVPQAKSMYNGGGGGALIKQKSHVAP